MVRIVSLVPGATESLFALGLEDGVVAVTHECDLPAPVSGLPRVTWPNLDLAGLDGEAIDRQVGAAAAAGQPLYLVDFSTIRKLRPDLVIVQDVCAVCAVAGDRVAEGLQGIPLLRQHQHTLEDVLEGISELASACGADAGPLLAGLRARIDAVAARARARPPLRAIFLEWLDPPYVAGHWTPDLLELAGIEDPLARPHAASVPASWDEVGAGRPEALFLAPCGFPEDRARLEAERMRAEIERTGARHVAVFDGSRHFNRPGPRLVESLELLAREVERLRTR